MNQWVDPTPGPGAAVFTLCTRIAQVARWSLSLGAQEPGLQVDSALLPGDRGWEETHLCQEMPHSTPTQNQADDPERATCSGQARPWHLSHLLAFSVQTLRFLPA